MGKVSRFIINVVALLAMVAGGYIIWIALHQPPEPTPELTGGPVTAPSTQKPTGPKTATVNGQQVAPANMKPSHLFIPALSIYPWVNTTGDNGKVINENFVLPEAKEVTQWNEGAKVTSEKGHIVVSGHVKWNSTRGALYDLAKLQNKLGSYAFLSDAQGNTQAFQLEHMEEIKKASLSSSTIKVWDAAGPKKLIVITCGGELIPMGNNRYHYESNTVAVFKPVGKPVLKKAADGNY